MFMSGSNCNASSLSDRAHRQHGSAPRGGFATTQVTQGQGPCSLDLTQRKTGLKIFHVGQIDETLQGKTRKTVQVFGHHLQLERAIAADVVTRNDLRQAGDGGFELTGGIARIAFGIDPHERQHPQADFPTVQFGTVTHYVTTFFERTHTPPTWRCRQTHTVGQFGVAEAAVTLQGMQDGQIKLVNHFYIPPSLAIIFLEVANYGHEKQTPVSVNALHFRSCVTLQRPALAIPWVSRTHTGSGQHLHSTP